MCTEEFTSIDTLSRLSCAIYGRKSMTKLDKKKIKNTWLHWTFLSYHSSIVRLFFNWLFWHILVFLDSPLMHVQQFHFCIVSDNFVQQCLACTSTYPAMNWVGYWPTFLPNSSFVVEKWLDFTLKMHRDQASHTRCKTQVNMDLSLLSKNAI